ncbi:MAG: hypothetical protein ABEH38_08340 [Flavobacteriales bacterium]
MENRELKVILNVFKIVLVLLGASMTLFIWTGTNLVGEDAGGFEAKIREEAGYGLWIAYIIGGACAAAAILFSIFQVIVNFKRSIPALVGVALFAIILLISYNSASSEVPGYLLENDKLNVNGTLYQLVGGGIISIYVFTGITILTIVVSEVRRIIIGSKS